MSEASEEKKGSGIGGVVVGVAAGAGAAYGIYERNARNMVDVARKGGEEAAKLKPEFVAKVGEVLSSDAALKAQQTAIDTITADGNIASAAKATISKAAGEGAKGIDIALRNAEGAGVTLNGVTKGLPKAAQEALKATDGVGELTGDALKSLTDGDKGSWVAKTAKNAQQNVNQAIRKSEGLKSIGGTFKNMSLKGKAAAVVGGVVAAVAVGGLVNAMFNKKGHRDRVDQGQATAAGRA